LTDRFGRGIVGSMWPRPLYWAADPLFLRQGVKCPAETVRGGWNFFNWDKE